MLNGKPFIYRRVYIIMSITRTIKIMLVLILTGFCTSAALARVIAYDPFVNANVDNGQNSKTSGEYNAGSQFRDFTNGNNADVAGGMIIGFSSVNLWQGNSGASTGDFSHIIGPTDLTGLTFGSNEVYGGNVQARGFSTTGVSYARRVIDSYTGSPAYYISALVRGDNLSGNLDIRAMTGFTTTLSHGAFDGSSLFPGVLFGFWGDGSKVDLVVRHRDDDSGMVNDVLVSNVADGRTYFVVIKIEYDKYNGSEELSVWVDTQLTQESPAAAALVTTGKILTSMDQITHAGFWIENFDSSVTDYVQFDELILGTEWSDAVNITSGSVTTLSEMAVSDYVRPNYAPEYSDVCVSSRWLRGQDFQDNAKFWGTIGTPDERSFETLEVLKMYHATRLEWIYLYGQKEIDFIPKVRAEGITVAIAQTSNLSDEPGGTGKNLKGRMVGQGGNFLLDSIQGKTMGCANNEVFKQIFLREARSRIDAGATSIQFDHSTLNDGYVCWCEYCNGTKDGFESTTEFYQWLHNQLDAYYLQQYGLGKFPIHGNNSSHTVYSESFFSPSDDYRLDYGCSETNIQDVSAQHFHNIGVNMRTYQDVSRAQIITSPGTWGYPDPVYLADFTDIVRRSVGNCYAQGINMMAPFDRFGTDLVDGGDQNQGSRFFGDPQYFGDLFGFIRGIAIYLDGYEFGWDWGKTTKARYHVPDTPYGDTWGTPPGPDQPVAAIDDGIAVVIRAVPGENDEPIAVHLVDWDVDGPFTITLNNEKYFGESGDNLRLTLLEPLDNYNPDDYLVTGENLDYVYYVKSTELSGSYGNGQTTVSIPQLGPWGVLMVSKDKTVPLPLYNSPRWQQLKDQAPANAEYYYPADNEIVTPVQSIMLSFDKDMDVSTVNSNNIIVKHEQSGSQISGNWTKLGNILRFTPSQVYQKGTISVELTPELKRSNGTSCLRQKFYYECGLDIADMDGDFSVDYFDLSDLAAGWLKYTSIGDVSSNGFVGIEDLKGMSLSWLNCYVPQAEPVSPVNGQNFVSTDVLLKWDGQADTYDVYFSGDASEIQTADFGSPCFVQNTALNIFNPAPLLPDSDYYWRIDTIAGGCTTKGMVNAFSTTPQNTQAYWELDSDGGSSVGRYTLQLRLGSLTPDNVNFAAINNPDTTTPWNSTSTAAQNGSSLYFDGQTALVFNGPDSPFQFKRSVPFTCEAYIRATAENDGIVFGTRDTFSGFYGWYLKYDSSNQRLSWGLSHPGGSSSAYSDNGVIGLNQLKHVALVWDPSTGTNGQIRIYVEGVLVAEKDGEPFWDDTPEVGWNFMVGGRNIPDNIWGFVGQIDEVRWSNYALDPTAFLNASNP